MRDRQLFGLSVLADRREQRGLVFSPRDAAPGLVGFRGLLSDQVGQGSFQRALPSTGDRCEPVGSRAFAASVVRRADEVSAQVAGLEVVGAGQAADVGVPTFSGFWPWADRQQAESAVVVRAGGHEAGRALRFWAARSSFTLCRDLRVIFSVPFRIASMAAPRMRWDREPIIPPVRSWR